MKTCLSLVVLFLVMTIFTGCKDKETQESFNQASTFEIRYQDKIYTVSKSLPTNDVDFKDIKRMTKDAIRIAPTFIKRSWSYKADTDGIFVRRGLGDTLKITLKGRAENLNGVPYRLHTMIHFNVKTKEAYWREDGTIDITHTPL